MTGISAAAASAGSPGADVSRHAFLPDAALVKVPSSGSFEQYTPASDGTARVASTPTGMPPRILLAEDNAVNSMIARRFLRTLGYPHVTLAENGQEAVDALQADTPSLVLMDCQMPVMDGYEATRRIRALPDPVKRTVPIIALTASALKADVDRCMAAGMDDHLSKPYDSKALGAKLARWLRPGVPHRRASSAPVVPTEEELVTRTPSAGAAEGRSAAARSSVLLGLSER
jgi:CheY-like chemotaxis protein